MPPGTGTSDTVFPAADGSETAGNATPQWGRGVRGVYSAWWMLWTAVAVVLGALGSLVAGRVDAIEATLQTLIKAEPYPQPHMVIGA